MAPSLKLVLPDGRKATLLLGEASTVLAVGDTLVSSWDLVGRPYALVREDGSYRRGLDGRLLLKREATRGSARVRRRLTPTEGAPVVEAARTEALMARDAVRAPAGAVQEAEPEALARLGTVVAMDTPALQADAERFLAACGPVGILPPDQYLSLVVRVTEGCSWNACAFCRCYAGVPFRVKTPAQLAAHLAALRDYFGRSLALRRSVFLGDANALRLPEEQLGPLVEQVVAAFPGAPLHSFVDTWTGHRKGGREWGHYRSLGLRRVYVGLETGDPAFLSWLGKPGEPGDAVGLVRALHEGGVAAGVIVLVGAGGERFSAAHIARTIEVLEAMRLGPRDIVYLSDYVDDPTLAYGRLAAGAPDLAPLAPPRARAQREALARALRGSGPRLARYDLRELVY